MTSFGSLVLYLASVGAGLNAGLFFIFSVCVMRALEKLPPSEGIAAMNAINVAILNPLFFLVFMGTALLAVAILVLAVLPATEAGAAAIAAALVFLIGVMGVTVVINVPMNEALAAVDPSSPEAVGLWERYLERWTNWNHVRSTASLVATMLFVLGYAEAASA